jgi:antitoxin component HigA of HigAB toxin-antitoxin module
MTTTVENRKRRAGFEVRPIRNENDRKTALRRIEQLMDLKSRTQRQRDELHLLSILVQYYERERFPHEPVSPRELLESLFTDGGHKQIDVAHGAGIHPSTLSEILNGKRAINARHAVKLARYFKLRGDAFLPRDV